MQFRGTNEGLHSKLTNMVERFELGGSTRDEVKCTVSKCPSQAIALNPLEVAT